MSNWHLLLFGVGGGSLSTMFFGLASSSHTDGGFVIALLSGAAILIFTFAFGGWLARQDEELHV